MLTSTKNHRIQRIRKLQNSAQTRRKEALFVVEGVRLVEEVVNANWKPQFVLYTEDINDRGHQTVAHFQKQGVEVIAAAPHVMRSASDTQSPQGILAVVPIPEWQFPADPTFLVIPDGIRDPGNLGTLLRTALAAGVEALILPPEGTDAFSPKVVRAGMGAHFRLPIFSMDWESIQSNLASLSIFLADSQTGVHYYQAEFLSPLALIIGGEAVGAGSQAASLAASRIHIAMPGKTESLNAAIAGAILMFEVVRQRGLNR
jgi:RNA methyltransferase, TrmH family